MSNSLDPLGTSEDDFFNQYQHDNGRFPLTPNPLPPGPAGIDHLLPPFGPSSNSSLGQSGWFDSRFPQMTEAMRADFVDRVDSAILSRKDPSFNPVQVGGRLGNQNVEAFHGDDPQSWFVTRYVLGNYWFHLVNPGANVTYNVTQIVCGCEDGFNIYSIDYTWSATLAINDSLGITNVDTWLRGVFAPAFPPRDITRASWPLSSGGSFCPDRTYLSY